MWIAINAIDDGSSEEEKKELYMLNKKQNKKLNRFLDCEILH